MFLILYSSRDYPIDAKNHPNRAKQYEKYFSQYNTTELSFRLEIKDIKKFEINNKRAINVISYIDDKENEGDLSELEDNDEHERKTPNIQFYTEYLSTYYNSSIPEEKKYIKIKLNYLY